MKMKIKHYLKMKHQNKASSIISKLIAFPDTEMGGAPQTAVIPYFPCMRISSFRRNVHNIGVASSQAPSG